MTTTAALITSIRTKGNDTSTSNLVLGESPVGQGNQKNDGSNTHFRLQNTNLVTGSVYVTINTSYRATTGFTMDLVNGLVVFASAPAANANPFYIDYNFQWFTDTDYTDFITDATRDLGYSYVDPTTVPDTLIPALEQYALYYYWTRRASRYAHKYSSSGGSAGQQVDVVTENFLSLAKMAKKCGVDLRDDYYKKQGRQYDPASGTVTYQFDPMSPIR